MFENSADFFGRIIVYSLDVLGGKASWPIFFFNPLMREEMTPEESTGCRTVWWHLGNMSSVLPPHELMWMWPFLVWTLSGICWAISILITQTRYAMHGVWIRVLIADLMGFFFFIYNLFTLSILILCLWVEAPFQWNTQYKNKFLLKLVHSPFLLSSKQTK